ncbi:hypothetical protein GQ457_03G046790 [Hibiscus cannabinus]
MKQRIHCFLIIIIIIIQLIISWIQTSTTSLATHDVVPQQQGLSFSCLFYILKKEKSSSLFIFGVCLTDIVPAFSGVNFDSKQVSPSCFLESWCIESSSFAFVLQGGRNGGGREETYGSGLVGRLGSRPPNCQRKCGGCEPCVATQIPATTDKLGVQYTNYKPEGWKCKCGSTFFSP